MLRSRGQILEPVLTLTAMKKRSNGGQIEAFCEKEESISAANQLQCRWHPDRLRLSSRCGWFGGHVYMMSTQGGGEGGGTPKADAERKPSNGGCMKMQTRGWEKWVIFADVQYGKD